MQSPCWQVAMSVQGEADYLRRSMLAGARAEGDADAVRRLAERGARLGAIACGLFVSVIAAIPGSLLRFAFSADVAERVFETFPAVALTEDYVDCEDPDDAPKKKGLLSFLTGRR